MKCSHQARLWIRKVPNKVKIQNLSPHTHRDTVLNTQDQGVSVVFGGGGKQCLAGILKPPPGNTKWQRGSWCHITSGRPSLHPSAVHRQPTTLNLQQHTHTHTQQKQHSHCVSVSGICTVPRIALVCKYVNGVISLTVDTLFLEATCVYIFTHAQTHTQDAAFPQAVAAPIKWQLTMSNGDKCVCRLV